MSDLVGSFRRSRVLHILHTITHTPLLYFQVVLAEGRSPRRALSSIAFLLPTSRLDCYCHCSAQARPTTYGDVQ